MATISIAAGATAGRTVGSVPYLVDVTVDFAAAATSKGSALAAADVIECISVPTNTCILNAGLEVITAAGGESSDTTYDLGTGVDADCFVDGFDGDAAAAGAYATATTAPTSGKVRVWAVLMNVDGRVAADEVDRDQLA